MDRRTFLARAGLVATWAGIPITIGCGSDDNGMNPGGGNGDVVGSVAVSSGHTHSGAVVTAAEISAANAVTLTLTGSGHTHTVNLSAQEVMDIGGGQTVITQSSTDDGHSHTVTFN